jgi:hypothetical protein
MLSDDELRAAWAMMWAPGPRPARAQRVENALRATLRAYDHEAALPEPRLDCLTTAVRALAGALRERMER